MSDDDDSRKQKATVIGGCCCLLLALAGGLIGCSFGIVGINEVGLDFDSIAVVVDDSKLFENGRFFIGLGHGFLLSPTYLMPVEFKKAGSEDIGWDTDKSASGGVLACARSLAEEVLRPAGGDLIDSPVSGGPAGAVSGQLTAMVGGSPAAAALARRPRSRRAAARRPR